MKEEYRRLKSKKMELQEKMVTAAKNGNWDKYSRLEAERDEIQQEMDRL